MQTETTQIHTQRSQMFPVTPVANRYERAIQASKRARWELERDVIRGRTFDFSTTFLPNGLTKLDELTFLSADDRRLMSQIQGRTYANIFGLVERFINAKVLEVSRDHWFADQTALEALVRFSDEELKHQEMFRRIERMIGVGMPEGYVAVPRPNDVAAAVLSKSTWAVLGLTLDIELFTQLHYRSSIDPETQIDPLWKDVFLFHWKEESQHAILDEMEWMRENDKLDAAQRDKAVDELIALVAAVDGICQMQAQADAEYFVQVAGRAFDANRQQAIHRTMLAAYRWPGNIRELKNVVERIVLKSGGRAVTAGDLPADLLRAIAMPTLQAGGASAGRQGPTRAEELATQMLDQRESFWSAVYPMFMSRDMTRAELRQIVQIGLECTNGNYRMLVERFNMPTEDYKRFLSFLRKHDCHLPFQRFRAVPAKYRPDEGEGLKKVVNP